VLEQAAQRDCGYPIPEGVQGQVGWGPGQPGLVLHVEVDGPAWGGWRFMILKVSSNLGHCDSVVSHLNCSHECGMDKHLTPTVAVVH